MARKQIINGFWGGFINPADGAPTLLQTPYYVDVVTLAFTGPADDNAFSTDYLCSWHSPETIQGWVKTLQSRGQRVLLSVYDNPKHQWHDVDIPKFVKNAVSVIVDQWGVDGIDIDGESGNATADDFIELITEFRSALGSKGAPDAIISYDTFAFSTWDQQILKTAGDCLDWINLMAYFRGYDSMLELFDQYATLIDPGAIAIGVKPGKGPLDQSTNLEEVAKLAAYQPTEETKRGIMLYHLARDIPHFTDKPMFTWANAIHQNLPAE